MTGGYSGQGESRDKVIYIKISAPGHIFHFLLRIRGKQGTNYKRSLANKFK